MIMGSGFVRGYNSFSVTPSDTLADPYGPFDALYTGTGGNITIVSESGKTVLLNGTAAGVVLPINFSRIAATGTAATAIVGLKLPGAG
jgi:hypothetical protein